MKKLVLSLAMGLALAVLGTNDAMAAGPFCIDFDNFCDCLSVNPVGDTVDGENVRRLDATWENQDCAGTSSPMQGMARDQAQSIAGELNSVLGLDGTNFNFTVAGGVFDLDATGIGKIQDEQPFTRVAGACAPGCPALKRPGLPPSRQK